MTINEQAQAAINALNALNDFAAAWNESVKAKGYAAAFRESPRMADHLHRELLEAIVAFDEDALGTLVDLRLYDEPDEGSGISDEEFDYRTGQAGNGFYA